MDSPYAVVTGASSPIGAAIAKKLALGRRLVLHGRNHEKLVGVRNACANPLHHLLWEQDLNATEEIAPSLISLLADRKVWVDTLVHCAGGLHLGAFRLLSPDLERELFAVNVFSAMEIVRVLAGQKGARVALTSAVFISSGASLFGAKGNATYTATKGALDAFMKSLAMDLAPRGRSNSVLPGMIEGGMSDLSRQDASFEDTIKANYPLGLGRPADVAAAVEFLLSNNSRWITGQQILVDGGYSAHCNHI
jgi:NAD(P)-dependent dehydrogenase (short-subunit alcohol dehydrogenase family)